MVQDCQICSVEGEGRQSTVVQGHQRFGRGEGKIWQWSSSSPTYVTPPTVLRDQMAKSWSVLIQIYTSLSPLSPSANNLLRVNEGYCDAHELMTVSWHVLIEKNLRLLSSYLRRFLPPSSGVTIMECRCLYEVLSEIHYQYAHCM